MFMNNNISKGISNNISRLLPELNKKIEDSTKVSPNISCKPAVDEDMINGFKRLTTLALGARQG